jgi:hypothetical protein
MAIKRESGSKKPMGKMASKAKPKTVSVDPSSASASINAAKKKMTKGGTDYEVSRAADAYAKTLRKYGVKITPENWAYYKPGPGSNAMGAANKPKGSLKPKAVSKSNPKAPRGR